MFKTKSLLHLSLFLLAFTLVATAALVMNNKRISSALSQLAFALSPKIQTVDLQDRYVAHAGDDARTMRDLRRQGKKSNKIRILIVPGHDSEFKGTQYKGTDEVELNRKVAHRLHDFLSRNPDFEVEMAHKNDEYNPELENYFIEEREAISNFTSEYKSEMKRLVEAGEVNLHSGVFHNSAPSEAAFRLYGINKWVNDNEFDIVLHIHFNDYPGRSFDEIGNHTGFSLYVPEAQFSNSPASKRLAQKIKDRLEMILPISSHKLEQEGIVEDQELIAIGANNTLEALSILIEYGYIYEPQFHGQTQDIVLEELAYQTYAGIMRYFNDEEDIEITKTLPHRWKNDLSILDFDNPDVYALQSLLRFSRFYPPRDTTFNVCPMTGDYDICTELAVKEFQEHFGIRPTGEVGRTTRIEVNNIFIEKK